MTFNYLAQDEFEVIDYNNMEISEKIKDPIEITIKITMSKNKYQTRKNKYKTSIPDKIRKIFE